MSKRETTLVDKIARVQELCECLARTSADGKYMVTFANGTAEDLQTVLAEGREALVDVAGFFDVSVPPVATPPAPGLSEEAASAGR